MTGDIHDGTGPRPMVRTSGGPIRGLVAAGVAAFRGIPYGASPSGTRRFQPPAPPTAWTQIRDCFVCGPQAPQWQAIQRRRPTLEVLLGSAGETAESEDCLRLNVWSPELDPGAGRAVMVWLHGGGFASLSANWAVYDGANLARLGDVVVVSLNHRLSIFGHLLLTELGGERYAHSGNAGLLDVIAALGWVRDNIAAFGGDPDRVTIFGESGGGSKVSALLAMPAALGLFQRAIIQSGAGIRFASRDRAQALTEATLRVLDISPRQLDRLHELPTSQLLAAIEPARRALGPPGHPLLDRYDFGPVVDGVDLPTQPFDPQAPAQSADVPVLIGDNRDEITLYLMGEDAVWNGEVSEHELTKRVAEVAGEDARLLLQLYGARDPSASPTERLIAILTGLNFWIRSVLLAERKAKLGAAPVYMYSLAWPSPAFGGRLRAHHMLDLPLVFGNYELASTTAGAEGAAGLSTIMIRSWAGFARSGTPAHSGLPDWPAYTAEQRSVMQFDTHCHVVSDPDPTARMVLTRLAERVAPHPPRAQRSESKGEE